MPPGPSRLPSSGRVAVRDLRWTDFDDLRENYYRLYDERERGEFHGITLFRERPTHASESAWFSDLFRRVLAGDAIVVVADVDGRAVGSCTVTRAGLAPDAENGHVGTLGILVTRTHRGRGVGTALLTEALARSRGKFEVVRLSVFSSNERAKDLYRRFGFRPSGAIPRAIRRGDEYYDEELMTLLLDGPAVP